MEDLIVSTEKLLTPDESLEMLYISRENGFIQLDIPNPDQDEDIKEIIPDTLSNLIVNLTPHTLDIHMMDGRVLKILPSGIIARCEESWTFFESGMGLRIGEATYGKLSGLSFNFSEPHIYVVSMMVLNALNNVYDNHLPSDYPYYRFFAPGPAIRDNEGKIIGCNGLSAHRLTKNVTTGLWKKLES